MVGEANMGTVIQNRKYITRMENAQVQARLENARIIGRLMQDRLKSAPTVSSQAPPNMINNPPPPGLTQAERDMLIRSVRARMAAMQLSETAQDEDRNRTGVSALSIGLRGLEQTQSLEAIEAKGDLVDRLV